MYAYIKALHIIFVVTWFAGIFYMPRLFIYNVEAGEKSEIECTVLRNQFAIMIKRLWLGITWPSAILTFIFGITTLVHGGWWQILFTEQGRWLLIKLFFVLLLYLYHFSLHNIYKQQLAGIFKYSSNKLRIWNEVATIFLVAIVFLVVVKQSISLLWGLLGLICLILLLLSAIKIYKRIRLKEI